MADDDGAVEQYLKQFGDKPTKPTARLSEFGPGEELLAAILDRLGDAVTVLVTANGGETPNYPRWTRPVTAIDRARTRQDLEDHMWLVAKLTPHELNN